MMFPRCNITCVGSVTDLGIFSMNPSSLRDSPVTLMLVLQIALVSPKRMLSSKKSVGYMFDAMYKQIKC